MFVNFTMLEKKILRAENKIYISYENEETAAAHNSAFSIANVFGTMTFVMYYLHSIRLCQFLPPFLQHHALLSGQ